MDLQKRWGDLSAHAILWAEWLYMHAADVIVNVSVGIGKWSKTLNRRITALELGAAKGKKVDYINDDILSMVF